MTHGPSAPRDEVSAIRAVLSPDGTGIRLDPHSGLGLVEGADLEPCAAIAPTAAVLPRDPEFDAWFAGLAAPSDESVAAEHVRFDAADSAEAAAPTTPDVPPDPESLSGPDLRRLVVPPEVPSASIAPPASPSDPPVPSRRARLGAFAASSLLHAALLTVLSVWTLPQIARIAEPTIDAAFDSTDEAPEIATVPPILFPIDPADRRGEPGAGRASFVSAAASASSPAADPVAAVSRESAPRSVDPSALVPFAAEERVAWNEVVGSLAEWSRASFGAGAEDGSGGGSGSGTFFGRRVAGRSFVYVIDCSLSMNAPHDSPAKTRFRRVKLEIVRSVAAMTPEDRFFVVFFNDQIHAMPARGLESAVPESKHRHLEWMTTVRATGDTDPRGALRLALSLRPDVIHFLSDGDFVPQIAREVLSLRQSASSLHTYSFESRKGEKLLRTLAEQNGGEYHAIP